MRIVISGKEVNLVDRDVKVAKKLCRRFLKTAKQRAEEAHAPTFYLTLLVVMHLMANDYISAISSDTLAILLNASYQNEENRSQN